MVSKSFKSLIRAKVVIKKMKKKRRKKSRKVSKGDLQLIQELDNLDLNQ